MAWGDNNAPGDRGGSDNSSGANNTNARGGYSGGASSGGGNYGGWSSGGQGGWNDTSLNFGQNTPSPTEVAPNPQPTLGQQFQQNPYASPIKQAADLGNDQDTQNNMQTAFNSMPNIQADDSEDKPGFLMRMLTPTPGSLAYRLGMRAPGTTAESMFNSETPAERDDRMGLVSNAIGTVGSALINTMMPAPMMLATRGISALHDYFNPKTISPIGYTSQQTPQTAIGNFASNLPGYFGAIGSALKGNYGSAVTQAASKYGATPLSAIGLGTATSAATGGNWKNGAAQFGGQAVGQQIGGPAAGAFGRTLGGLFSRGR